MQKFIMASGLHDINQINELLNDGWEWDQTIRGTSYEISNGRVIGTLWKVDPPTPEKNHDHFVCDLVNRIQQDIATLQANAPEKVAEAVKDVRVSVVSVAVPGKTIKVGIGDCPTFGDVLDTFVAERVVVEI